MSLTQGGGGLALNLLKNKLVGHIHLNDADPAIYCFWRSVLNHTKKLIDKIESTPVTMDEWHRQREIINDDKPVDDVTLGFATFFLNRTNRSGIIKKAGVIGGQAQAGQYKLDCRFNKTNLIHKIKEIAANREKISVSNIDAVTFMNSCQYPHAFYFIDPPYVEKGSSLYNNYYQPSDHQRLAHFLTNCQADWV